MLSAIAFNSSKLSINHCSIFKASLTPSHLIAGARVMMSDTTLAFAPPDAVMVDAPLLIDATNAPSEVARGMNTSLLQYSPLIFRGPAIPIGSCNTPIEFSMLRADALSMSRV